MTAIVGAVNQDTKDVWMGCDSAVTSSDFSQFTKTSSKIFRNGPFLIGTCGSVRVGQLLQHSFKPPDHDPRWSIDKFMVTEFADKVRECLKKGGALSITNTNEEHIIGYSNALVGYRGRLFHVYSDLQVTEPDTGFTAAGCAQDLGRGALDVLLKKEMADSEMMLKALRVCERWSGGVKRPYWIACLPYEKSDKVPQDLPPLQVKE